MCTTLGYIIQFDPKEGKVGFYFKELGLGRSVVLNLVTKLPSNGY